MAPARVAHHLVLLAVVSGCAARGERPLPDAGAGLSQAAVHHEVQLTLLPDRERVLVEDTVTLSPELRARLGDTIVFSLHAGLAPVRVGAGAPLVPARAAATRAAGDESGEDEGDVRLPLESFAVALGPGERSLTLRYGGRIFHPVESRGEEYARSVSDSPGIVSKEGAVLSGATHWLPELSDGFITFALEARVPAGWDVVSQGARTRHERGPGGTVTGWRSAEPQREAFVVAGSFVERSRQGGRPLVQTFLRSDDPALADAYLAAGEQYLEMYERLLGPYPYPKLAVVENFWETGFGMPSFTLLGPKIVRFPFILHSSYPHEILHNWWGNGVFVDAKRGNWCEGLTAYLADHLVEEQRGRGAEHRRTSLQRYADYVAENRDIAVRAFRERHSSLTQAVGYDKVLMIFHMLRQRMGDERFVRALRRFYEENRFRAASFDDVSRAMSAAAGEDLGPWLAQWIDRPGAPRIRLESVEVHGRERFHELELTLAQTQDGAPYDLEVPVVVSLPSAQQAVKRTVHLAARRQQFTLELDEAPARVDIDPEYDVFRRLDPTELPPALSGAFGASRRVIVLPSRAPAELRSAYAALAESWRSAGTEIVSDADLADLPAGKSVWLLGWENRLRNVVADGLKPFGGTLSADELRVGTTVLSRRRHAIVVAVRSPADAAQVVALVGAERAAALPGLARKLPHYGKYGLLGFEGEEPSNVAKETWPVLASSMTAVLGHAAEVPPRGALPARRPLAELPPPPAAAARPKG